MTVLYLNLCYNEVCYKGSALYFNSHPNFGRFKRYGTKVLLPCFFNRTRGTLHLVFKQRVQ